MDSGVVAIIVAVVSLAGTMLAAYFSLRAQKTESAVTDRVALFEGYDEFVAHLRARIEELEKELGRMLQRAKDAADECERCRAALQAARTDYYNLTSITKAMREQLNLPPNFGEIPLEMILDDENRKLIAPPRPAASQETLPSSDRESDPDQVEDPS